MSHASCFFVEVTVNCCVNFLIHSDDDDDANYGM